jgi:hypothetical protein
MTGSSLKPPKPGSAGSLLMMLLNSKWETDLSVLETDALEAVQESPGLLKQKVSGVITRVGKFERKKRKYCLEAVMGREWNQCSKKTWVPVLRFIVFSNKILLLQRLLRMWGSLVKTLPSKIILL